MKKFISCLLAGAMLVMSTAAFAAAPSAYDKQAYSSLGYESNDPDGQLNLAVVANGDVKIVGDAMYIEGSVYSNGNIYVGNGAGNVVKGLFISGTESTLDSGYGTTADVLRNGYIHVDDDMNESTNAYSTAVEYEGAIHDADTSFGYTYTPYTYPEISNYIEGASANRYRSVLTVTEDTHFGTVQDVNGAGLIIEAYDNDVNVVIDTLEVGANPFIQVVGDHHVNLYVKNWVQNGGDNVNLGLAVTDGNYDNWDEIDQWASNQKDIFVMDGNGIPRPDEAMISKLNPNQIDLYLDTESGVVNFQGARIAANIHTNAKAVSFGNSLQIYGNIESGAASFETVGSGYINGNVNVPNADSTVHNSSCIDGQLVTDTLLINGAGAILNGTDSINTNNPAGDDSKKLHLDIVEDVVYVVAGDDYKLNINHSGPYRWEFVNEGSTMTPEWNGFKDEAGNLIYVTNGDWDKHNDNTMMGSTVASEWWTPTGEFILKASLHEDADVCDTVKIVVVASADDIPSTPTPTPAPVPDGDEIDLDGVGYAYIFGYEPEIGYEYDELTGGHLVAKVQMAPQDNVTREQVAAMIMRLIDQKYDTKNSNYAVTSNISKHAGTWYERGLAYLASKGTFDGIDSVETGAVTRGEVAKLVAYGLNLSKKTDTAFSDIENSPYKSYIETMAAYGYMQGMNNTEFQPDKVMTRAEFCSMFNNIIGRNEMGLTAQDGTKVTPEIYSIVDLSGHWAEEIMLKATSAYDEKGLIDVTTRLSNIRNVLDNYDSQKWF